MTARDIFLGLFLTVGRAARRWLLNRQLAHIKYTLAHLESETENNRKVARMYQRQQALLQSDLRNS